MGQEEYVNSLSSSLYYQPFGRINCCPSSNYFKPKGNPMCNLEEVILEADEIEALRLADYLALSHESAASQMKISRATFGRIIEQVRKKVTDSLINGKAIKINDEFPDKIKMKISTCGKCGAQITYTLTSKKYCKNCNKT